jgi:hypothetical protein
MIIPGRKIAEDLVSLGDAIGNLIVYSSTLPLTLPKVETTKKQKIPLKPKAIAEMPAAKNEKKGCDGQ